MLQARRIAIADRNRQLRARLRSCVEQLGHTVIAEAACRAELEEACRRSAPELLIADAALNGRGRPSDPRDGTLLSAQEPPLVVISDPSDRAMLRQAYRLRPYGWLFLPLRDGEIEPVVTAALQRHAEWAALQAGVAAARRELEERKLVEQAKGLLMKHARIDEAEAFLRIRQTARKRRQTLAEVARSIVFAERMFGDFGQGQP